MCHVCRSLRYPRHREGASNLHEVTELGRDKAGSLAHDSPFLGLVLTVHLTVCLLEALRALSCLGWHIQSCKAWKTWPQDPDVALGRGLRGPPTGRAACLPESPPCTKGLFVGLVEPPWGSPWYEFQI